MQFSGPSTFCLNIGGSVSRKNTATCFVWISSEGSVYYPDLAPSISIYVIDIRLISQITFFNNNEFLKSHQKVLNTLPISFPRSTWHSYFHRTNGNYRTKRDYTLRQWRIIGNRKADIENQSKKAESPFYKYSQDVIICKQYLKH